ncbi:MAG: hypothetical protein M1830_003274 [Pleopsidium flavum]|nr:MAG: hypothetical protein M1830_003274 [Pleopsidium flavum]
MASMKESLAATSSTIPVPTVAIPDSVIIDSVASASAGVDTRLIFPFLKLPAEIRNRIYDLVFVSHEYIGANGTLTKAFYHEAAKYRNLAFASACRQIYQESANIFYAKNGFEFFYIRPFLEFLEAIGAKRRKLLTKLKYNYSSGTPFVVLRYLKSCTNLEELEVSARVVMTNRKNSWWAYPLKDAKGFFLGSNPVIEFGGVRKFGKAESVSDEPPSARVHKARRSLAESLVKVKREENGHYKR